MDPLSVVWMFMVASGLYLVCFGLVAKSGPAHEIPGITNRWYFLWLRYCDANQFGVSMSLIGVAVITGTPLWSWTEMLAGLGFVGLVAACMFCIHIWLLPQPVHQICER